jgi:uncharacterized protein (TIGR02145 family)
MKKLFTLLIAVELTVSVFAQAPQKMSYQAVIRNSGGTLVTNTQIGMEINIRQDSPTGTVVYTETQTPTTNSNGLVSIEIGGGAGFNTINWASDNFYIETKTAIEAPLTTYTITGVSQLLSVPYALHAKTTETETDPSVPVGINIGDMQYWNGTAWVTVPSGIEGQILTLKDEVPTWETVLGITFFKFENVYNPSTGKTWMDRNLGALQVATSSTDAAAYGYLYQWGRLSDGHQARTSGTTTTLSSTDNPGHSDFIFAPTSPNDWRSPQNTNLWQGVSGTNNPCPAGYRLPTKAEWDAERLSWSSNNAAGAFASPLKLPVAGARFYDCGLLHEVGYQGYYWSSTVNITNSDYLFFYSSYAKMENMFRAWGFSVRCIKD